MCNICNICKLVKSKQAHASGVWHTEVISKTWRNNGTILHGHMALICGFGVSPKRIWGLRNMRHASRMPNFVVNLPQICFSTQVDAKRIPMLFSLFYFVFLCSRFCCSNSRGCTRLPYGYDLPSPTWIPQLGRTLQSSLWFWYFWQLSSVTFPSFISFTSLFVIFLRVWYWGCQWHGRHNNYFQANTWWKWLFEKRKSVISTEFPEPSLRAQHCYQEKTQKLEKNFQG